jgi:Skp family chaperone for outer membrane proteins
MIVHCAAVMLAAGLSAGCDKVGGGAEASSASQPQAVIVDATAVSGALGRDKDLEQQMQDAGQRLQKQIEEQQTKFQAEINAKRESFGENPTQQQQQQLARMAQQAGQKLRRLQAMAQQRMQQLQARVINQFRDELSPVVKQIARENDAQLVLMNNNSVLWYDPAIDVTDQVIGALRAAENDPAATTDQPAADADANAPDTRPAPNTVPDADGTPAFD